MKIVEVNYGLGSVYSSFIELHYKLPQELKDKIVQHELNHSSWDKYTKQDFKNDFQSKNPYFIESLKFCMRNPEAFVGFFPIMYSYYSKAWTTNFGAIFPFFYFGVIFTGILWLLFKINIIQLFIAYWVFFVLVNIFLLILTHVKVRTSDFVYS